MQRSSRSQDGDGENGGQQRLPAQMQPGPLQRMPSPFALMSELSREMDRMFEGFWRGAGGGFLGGGGFESGLGTGLWSPEIEMSTRNGELVVRADLPGLREEDVEVEITDRALTIQGERQMEHEDREGETYRSERRYGSFFRSIPLPDGVDVGAAEARFENGVLEVRVPVPEQRESRRRIEVQRGSQQRGPGSQQRGSGSQRSGTGSRQQEDGQRVEDDQRQEEMEYGGED